MTYIILRGRQRAPTSPFGDIHLQIGGAQALAGELSKKGFGFIRLRPDGRRLAESRNSYDEWHAHMLIIALAAVTNASAYDAAERAA